MENKTTTGPAARCSVCERAVYLEMRTGGLYFSYHTAKSGEVCKGSNTEPIEDTIVGGIDDV